MGLGGIRKPSRFHFPRQKIEGARTFAQGDHFAPGSTQLRVRDVQVFRGLTQRWLVACFFWRTLLGVLDALLRHSGEKEEWIECPDPEVWTAWWAALGHIRSISAGQTAWGRLSTTTISSTLEIHRRLSGPREAEPATWLTSDASPLKA